MRTRHTNFPSFLRRGVAAFALLMAPAIGTSVLAQTTSEGQAKAIVLQPLSFFKVNDLDFGDIIASGTAGTVRLYPDGTRTASGGATLGGNGGAPSRFAGLGTPNQRVVISVGSNSIFITGPGQPMRVSNFDIGSTPTVLLSTSPLRFRIATSLGNFNFPVGATLDVNANQSPGDYSGTFAIILNYQ